MRQAGRSLPEYRSARGTGSLLDAISDPELAAELTLQPVRRYGVDAAILFSDIVVPLHAIGVGVTVVPGRGPVVAEPFSSKADLDRLRPYTPEEDAPYVGQAAALAVRELGPEVALVGFAGAPFTVASYLVEGGPSRTFARVKALMHSDPGLWDALVERLADMAAASLAAQVRAGATVVQLFDSWAGVLSPGEYARYGLPATRRVFEAIRGAGGADRPGGAGGAGGAERAGGTAGSGVPGVLFGVGTGELLPLMATAGAEVVGVDWRVPLDEARRRVGPGLAVQGNLDPAVCLAPWEVVAEEARDVLRRAGSEPGHVFNLGHGVLPETDPGVLSALVELVHAEGRAGVLAG